MPATNVHTVAPQVPADVVQQGIEGVVQIVVSLDANSHVTGTRVYRSASVILNGASLEAARNSTYRTAIRDCVPVASQYIFSVEFTRR